LLTLIRSLTDRRCSMFDVVNKNVQSHISDTGHTVTDRPSTIWRERDDNTARDLVGLPFIERGRRSFRHTLKLTSTSSRTAQLGATRSRVPFDFYRQYSLADRVLSTELTLRPRPHSRRVRPISVSPLVEGVWCHVSATLLFSATTHYFLKKNYVL